jgi:hypothetical protein
MHASDPRVISVGDDDTTADQDEMADALARLVPVLVRLVVAQDTRWSSSSGCVGAPTSDAVAGGTSGATRDELHRLTGSSSCRRNAIAPAARASSSRDLASPREVISSPAGDGPLPPLDDLARHCACSNGVVGDHASSVTMVDVPPHVSMIAALALGIRSRPGSEHATGRSFVLMSALGSAEPNPFDEEERTAPMMSVYPHCVSY